MAAKSTRRNGYIIPLLIIGLGLGWLLNSLSVLPGVDWIWTGGLGVCGIIVFVIGGFSRFTVVVGPFLIIGSVLSVYRQTGRLSLDIEVPILFILLGALLLLSHLWFPHAHEADPPKDHHKDPPVNR